MSFRRAETGSDGIPSRTFDEGAEIEQLTVDASVAIDPGQLKIVPVDLDVHREVSGMNEGEFGRAIKEAKQACPSLQRHDNVEVRLHAHLTPAWNHIPLPEPQPGDPANIYWSTDKEEATLWRT